MRAVGWANHLSQVGGPCGTEELSTLCVGDRPVLVTTNPFVGLHSEQATNNTNVSIGRDAFPIIIVVSPHLSTRFCVCLCLFICLLSFGGDAL